MSAIFVRPLPFAPAGTSPAPLGGSTAYLGNDHPGLVWRGATTGAYIILDLGSAGVSYDWIGVFGSNLRASDTVQIRTGSTASGTGAYAGAALAAYAGSKDPNTTTQSIYRLSTARAERYVRIDISAASHPDGFVQAARVVVGSGISTLGISFDAEHGFESQSVVTTGPGYRSVDAYSTVDSWKFSTGWITDASWYGEWAPLMRYASAGSGIMFVADDSTPNVWQNNACYGFLTGTSSGKAEAYNKWRVDSKIIAFSR